MLGSGAPPRPDTEAHLVIRRSDARARGDRAKVGRGGHRCRPGLPTVRRYCDPIALSPRRHELTANTGDDVAMGVARWGVHVRFLAGRKKSTITRSAL